MAKQYKIEDYVGKEFKYGIYVVGVDEAYKKEHPKSNRWIFKCFCGKEFSDSPGKIACGCHKSCGCLLSENGVYKGFTHGLSRNKFYHIWQSMIGRCYRPNTHSYPRYGGRGIYVCDEWRNDPVQFIKWAESTYPKEKGYSLDRRDNNGPYAPWNCHWATAKEQCRNRRSNTMVTMDGESKPIAEWCDIYQTKYNSVLARIQNGWEPEEAIKTKIGEVGTNQFSDIRNKGNA